MNEPRLTVSPAPHWHTGIRISTSSVALLLALCLPALNGILVFGSAALKLIFIAVATAVVVESLMRVLLKRPIMGVDLISAVVLGLVFALFLPAGAPWWLVVLGVVVAAIIGRQLYGGVGGHPFHPAMVGLVVLILSYPSLLSEFPAPDPVWKAGFLGWTEAGLDIFPLGAIKDMGLEDFTGYLEMYENPRKMFLFGNVAGPIGQVGLLAILIGGVLLCLTRHIRWLIPVSVLVTVAVLGAVFHAVNPEVNPAWYWHILSGSVLLIAFFVATDPTTSPVNTIPIILFGVGIGLLTIIIRVYGSYIDGGPFAVLLMNLLMPLLDRIRRPAYGKKVKAYA